MVGFFKFSVYKGMYVNPYINKIEQVALKKLIMVNPTEGVCLLTLVSHHCFERSNDFKKAETRSYS